MYYDSLEGINNYSLNVVSGKRLEFENDFGIVISEGKMIVSFKNKKQKIDEKSYNII